MSNNEIKVYTTASGAELRISAPSTKQVIDATNNRARYFAELAKKYKDEALKYSEVARLFAEANSDVTTENLEALRQELELLIATKQDQGDYALRSELPINVSELINDSGYVTTSEMEAAIPDNELPTQDDCYGKFLQTNGSTVSWENAPNGFTLFDTKLSDHILDGEDALGWALQGSYVSNSIYPDFYAKCLEEKEGGVATETTLGSNTITMYINSNGHQFYDISELEAVNSWFDTYGLAWFYGIDTENERIFLPRNNYFEQATGSGSEVGLGINAGLPNITGSIPLGASGYDSQNVLTGYGSNSGALYGTSKSLTNNRLGSGTSSTCPILNIDASLSNSIYGNSSTVQPSAIKKLLYICVGNSVRNEALVDTGQLASELQYKAEVDFSNIEPAAKSLCSSWAMPSNNWISLTLGSAGSSYTAPANGYILIRKFSNAAGQHLTALNTSGIGDSKISSLASQALWVWFPVKKDESFYINYTAGGDTELFRFIYAESEV